MDRQPTRSGANTYVRSLVAAFAMAGAMTLTAPAALAQPDPGLPPVPAPVDPLAPPVPVAPPADPLAAPPPVDPASLPPGVPPAGVPADPQAVTEPGVIPAGTPAGQNPTPFTGTPVFRPPTFNPVNGSMVGVGKPISIKFAVPIANRAMAEQAIHISSSPAVPGKFYWLNDTEVRWRPLELWPANTTVTIDASGTKSTFRTGESLIATADNATHQMTITRNGKVEKTFPMSMGKKGHDTPNGTYYVLEKFADLVMDSSTYGVPVNSAEGYKINVKDAIRIDNQGTFVHGAPWSVGDQGKRNVSHGCINISAANAQWFFDNFGSGDPVVVKNSVGTYTKQDGAHDWQV